MHDDTPVSEQGTEAAAAGPAARGVLLDELVAHLPDGFALVDPQGGLLHVNQALCDMTGFTREELLGAALPHPFWPPEHLTTLEASFLASALGETATLDLTLMRRDGRRFPVLLTPTTVRDADGGMRIGMATFKDVTGLRLAEAALHQQRADFQTLVENLDDVLVRYDLDLRFTYVSPSISRLVPMRPEDMLGRTNREAGFAEGLAELFDEGLRRCLATLEPTALEYRIAGLDGELVIESRASVVRDAAGLPTSLISLSRDITARHRTEQALRESEEKYRAVVERANDAVVIMDGERCLFGNETAARLSGYTREELEGLPVAAVLPASSRTQLLERARRRLAGEDLPDVYVTDLLHGDGSTFKAEVSAGVITYADAPADLLIIRDVTEREEAAAALRRSEAMRDAAERVAGVGSFRWDVATGEVTYSPQMFRLFDVDPDTFEGDVVSIVATRLHPDDRESLLRSMAAFEAAGTLAPQSFRVVHRDGTTHWLDGDASREPGPADAPPAITGYYRDVTEEREAERRLREAERRFRSLFEQSPVAIWEHDATGLQDLARRLHEEGVDDVAAHAAADLLSGDQLRALMADLSVNRASLELFGAADEAELRREFPRCFSAGTLASFARGLARLARGETAFEERADMWRLDGTPCTLDVSVALVQQPEGAGARLVVSFADITERLRAVEEVHRLNAELERTVAWRTAQRDALNRELEAFAYSASHDLRAPLRTIDGFSAMVAEDAADRLSEEDRRHLGRVREAAQRMGQLIDDLLGLTRISRRELVRTEVDMSGLTAEVVAELRAEAPARDIEVRIQPGMRAGADQALARLILYELLGNAWKFTGRNPTALVEVGATETEGHTEFWVKDDGAGYDVRYAEHLFGAFQRLHPSADYPGDGIGLATVQRLVARHGGTVRARGAVGRGATFSFTLPDEPDTQTVTGP